MCQQSPSLVHLGAGMITEVASCVLYVAMDVVKERMQVQTRSPNGAHGGVYYRDTVHAMETILKTEGVRGLYKGYTATLLSFGPQSALYFMFYEKYKAIARQYLKVEHVPPQYTLVGAALAGATASFVTNPLDLAKLRLQRSPHELASGVCLLFIRNEGVQALLKVAGARVAYHAPSSAIMMALLESCRRFFADAVEIQSPDNRGRI
ncbi:hypothetical protein FI667_g5165, partial [Globisporangium splendens]